MLAVHFGAGNIGRGFIGALLHQSGYHTIFVDVNESVVSAVNEQKEYEVILADEQKQVQKVSNISGIVSTAEPEKVIEAIAEADIVTTAVGPSILPLIAESIAKGLSRRQQTGSKPLNIIACENMIGGSTLLKEEVEKYMSTVQKQDFECLFGFPNAAVDRIVPNQSNNNILAVSVEPYYEWVVEQTAIIGKTPPVNGITFVPNLQPYIERKLFTVNTGHAVAAYVGMKYGCETIEEAMNNEEVRSIVENALKETGDVLIELYSFERQEHESYQQKILSRFVNPHLSDEVMRVGRGPLRKLGASDRLIRPALLFVELFKETPRYLTKAIAAALIYENDQDPEAEELQKMIAEKGYKQVLLQVSGLKEDHPLVDQVLQEIQAS